MMLESDKKFEDKLICFSKMTRILWILTWSIQNSQNFYFDWFIMCKIYNVWPKKVQKSYEEEYWSVMQHWKKTVLRFGKWHEEFGKYLPEHSKVSKLVLSWDPFIQSRKCVNLKYTDNLCYNNEKWCRIGRAIDFVFQNWYEKFDKFWSKYSNVSKFALGFLLNKVYDVWAEKV